MSSTGRRSRTSTEISTMKRELLKRYDIKETFVKTNTHINTNTYTPLHIYTISNADLHLHTHTYLYMVTDIHTYTLKQVLVSFLLSNLARNASLNRDVNNEN